MHVFIRRKLLKHPEWALYPVLQFPVIFTLETLRRVVPPLDALADRVQDRRRWNWYRNEVGEHARAKFEPPEEFRR